MTKNHHALQTTSKKPKTGFLQSPRAQYLLYTGASLCTTLAFVAMAGAKRPPIGGE